MIKCDICHEAYFLSAEALTRHRGICQAVVAYGRCFAPSLSSGATPAPPLVVTPTPVAETCPEPLDLSSSSAKRLRDRSSSSSPPSKKTKAHSHNQQPSTSSSHKSLSDRTTSSRKPSSRSDKSSKKRSSGHRKNITYRTSRPGSSQRSSRSPAHPAASTPPPFLLTWELKKGLDHARDYKVINSDNIYSLSELLDAAIPTVSGLIEDELDNCTSLKYNLVLDALYEHPALSPENFNFKTSNRSLFAGSTLDLRRDKEKLLAEEADVSLKNSGWSLVRPVSLTLRVSRFSYRKPLGSSYASLPRNLARRHATISVQNTDHRCFMYSVLVKHLEYVTHNTVLTEDSFDHLVDTYNFEGLNNSASLMDVRRFERINPTYSVNVFECGPEGEISPYKIVENDLADHFDLLLYRPSEDHAHYVYVTDFAKLIRPQISKGSNRITICKRWDAKDWGAFQTFRYKLLYFN